MTIMLFFELELSSMPESQEPKYPEPSSSVNESPEKTEVTIGGSIENSLDWKANISPMAIIKEAFVVCRPTRLPLGLAMLVTLGGMMILNSIFTPIEQMLDLPLALPLVQIFIAPLVTGLTMMGVHASLGGQLQTKQVFTTAKLFAPLIQLSVIIFIMGFVLTRVLSLFAEVGAVHLLMIALFQLLVGFSYPLFMEKRLQPIDAIKISFQSSWRYLHKIIACNLITVLLVTIGLLPSAGAVEGAAVSPLSYFASSLFIIFIAVPYHFVVNGILYRELFGIKVLVSNKDKIPASFGA